ncbi:MAG: serine/threonine protein kinase, partial [Gemmatimonadales bacterium]
MITDPSGGSTLDLPEDLQLLRPLGEGQTARVHLAREPALARLVAVKVLRPHVAADPIARRRFEREARSAARISHPHVTRVHRVGRLPGDEPYIVMEYIEGRTVRDILDAQGPMATPVARRILAEVASALEATHDQGIIHRDVRPDNILVENRTGRAVLGDFGIAALLESGSEPGLKLTGAGIRLGDVRYLSPEQIHGWPVTEESDVYSFGVLAYEVLTGEGPHRGHSDQEVISGHLQNNPTPLRELRPEL